MICYILLTFSATGNRNNFISPSEMYNDIFEKEKIYGFLETIYIKRTADKFYIPTYLTLNLLMLINIT